MTEIEKNTDRADNLEIYEAGLLIDPALSDADVETVFTGIKSFITEKGGEVISEEVPKRRELAYTMVKSGQGKNTRYTSGFFGWVKFELEKNNIDAVKATLEKEPKIIRFLLIKTVRENTLIYQRPPMMMRDGDKPRREIPKVQDGAAPALVVSEDELNKSIEKLIVE